MHVDWVTVTAQIINFLVLVWLLKRFLYGPITQAMARREQRIADRLAEAADRRREADEEAARLRRAQQDLAEERERLLETARDDAAALKRELEQEAREEVDQKRRAWQERVTEEREAFLRDLRTRTVHHVYAIARRVLAEFTDAEIEMQAAARFTDRLRELDADARRVLAHAAGEAGGVVTVESDIELSSPAKAQVTRTVHECLSEDLEVEYEVGADTLLGLRLRAGSRTVEWSLARFLDTLEENVAADLAGGAGSGAPQAA